MSRIKQDNRIRLSSSGVAIAIMIAVATLGGSCLPSTTTTLCERTGVRCEPGLVCTVDQRACTTPDGCGDGLLEKGEVCDDGNAFDGDGCSADCKSDETCGNGITDTAVGESCDDGNLFDGDGCSSLCSEEVCGNGIVDVGEQCDSGGADSPGCNKDCTFVKCGDGYANPAVEECDSGGINTAECNGLTCTTPQCGDGIYNAAAGEDCDTGGDTKACNGNNPLDSANSCHVPRCGDGYINMKFTPPGATAPEACDDGNNSNNDFCLTGPGGNCRVATCGDGFLRTASDATTPAEECDNGPNNSDTQPNACRKSCRRAFCGDGVKDNGEECDISAGPCATGKICDQCTCVDPSSP